jgi:hypothetical protein
VTAFILPLVSEICGKPCNTRKYLWKKAVSQVILVGHSLWVSKRTLKIDERYSDIHEMRLQGKLRLSCLWSRGPLTSRKAEMGNQAEANLSAFQLFT